MNYPENCIKGIPNNSFLIEDGSVASHLFYFKKEHSREDGWIEQSINWDDNTFTIGLTFAQRKENGDLQFKVGAAKIPLEEIDRLSRQPTVNGLLSYERQPLKNNPFHGNLLISIEAPAPTMKKIAAGLALAVSEILFQPQNEA